MMLARKECKELTPWRIVLSLVLLHVYIYIYFVFQCFFVFGMFFSMLSILS